MAEINRRGAWYAVQVRACREKKACEFLQSQGYECLLPLAKSRRRWSDRIKVVETPLIPGYIFCRLDPLDRRPILMAPWVIQIVGIGRTPVAVDEREIAAIERVGMSGLPAQSWSYDHLGWTARIEEGPLRGLTGTIVGVKSECKLILTVSLLKRAVAVTIDPRWLGAFQPGGAGSGAPARITALAQNVEYSPSPSETLC